MVLPLELPRRDRCYQVQQKQRQTLLDETNLMSARREVAAAGSGMGVVAAALAVARKASLWFLVELGKGESFIWRLLLGS